MSEGNIKNETDLHNPAEDKRTTAQKWADRNRDKLRLACRKWRAKNKDKQSELNRKNQARYMRDGKLERKLNSIKQGAKARGLEFALSTETVDRLTKSACHYCGTPAPPQRGGIDRVDNTKGYTETNVVASCRTCNTAKWNKTGEEFKEWIDRLAKTNGYKKE